MPAPSVTLKLLQGRPSWADRFDRLTTEALAAALARRGHEVAIIEAATAQQAAPTGVGELEQGGARFTGLLHDALIIEAASGAFTVLDWQDAETGPARALAASPQWRAAALAFYGPAVVPGWFGRRAGHVYPGWFSDQFPRLTRWLRAEAAERRERPLDPRLYFAGTIEGLTPGARYQIAGHNPRALALVLREKYPDEVEVRGEKDPREQWLRRAAGHVACLALNGHPWCYREFELFSLGVPVVALPWTSALHAPWVPGRHYVAPVAGVGPREPWTGLALDPEQAADALMRRWRAARGDPAELRAMAARAQAHYDAYYTPEAVARAAAALFEPALSAATC